MTRTILHADLDAFYAAVEQLDDPQLRGVPVVVGGSAEGRGVVAAASYEARSFGVRSAMPMSRALRLCPNAVRVSPRFARYAEVSHQVMAIFRALTPLVEPLSLDEAFLDVTGWVRDGANPETIGRGLKEEVKAATGLTLSVGIGANKSVAKIASDLRKPDGLVVVAPGSEAAFLAPMPARALWGVGPKTESALARAGIRTIADLARRTSADAQRLLGSHGEFLHAIANGIDEREVVVEHERKSVGAERTFPRDLADGEELRAALAKIALEVAGRLQHAGVAARTIALKLRYSNFHTITRQASLKAATADAQAIAGDVAGVARQRRNGRRRVQAAGYPVLATDGRRDATRIVECRGWVHERRPGANVIRRRGLTWSCSGARIALASAGARSQSPSGCGRRAKVKAGKRYPTMLRHDGDSRCPGHPRRPITRKDVRRTGCASIKAIWELQVSTQHAGRGPTRCSIASSSACLATRRGSTIDGRR